MIDQWWLINWFPGCWFGGSVLELGLSSAIILKGERCSYQECSNQMIVISRETSRNGKLEGKDDDTSINFCVSHVSRRPYGALSSRHVGEHNFGQLEFVVLQVDGSCPNLQPSYQADLPLKWWSPNSESFINKSGEQQLEGITCG